MKFSGQQAEAIAAVSQWLKDPDKQLFRLFGFAGTGKTTIAKHLAALMDREPAFAAFTGKAAKVLQDKGCGDASTIHGLIYKFERDEKTGLTKWMLSKHIMTGVDVVIVDECSMVSQELALDLMSFGKKILVLGDPAQLPPVKSTKVGGNSSYDGGYFTEAEPDFLLTEVHRQAAESNILRLATQVRLGTMPSRMFEAADLTITRKPELDQRSVIDAGAVLVGKNVTRDNFNRRLRELNGFAGEFPRPGETLICLRNNREMGLLNGGMWRVFARGHTSATADGSVLSYELEDMDYPGRFVRTRVFEHFFQGESRKKELNWQAKRGTDEFDYGYAITVHKSQGSQWNDVCLFDESAVFGKDRARFLYTGITRAAKHLTLVL